MRRQGLQTSTLGASPFVERFQAEIEVGQESAPVKIAGADEVRQFGRTGERCKRAGIDGGRRQNQLDGVAF